MKCTEYFYSFREAKEFFKSIKKELAPELVQTVDEDTSEKVYIIFLTHQKNFKKYIDALYTMCYY